MLDDGDGLALDRFARGPDQRQIAIVLQRSAGMALRGDGNECEVERLGRKINVRRDSEPLRREPFAMQADFVIEDD